MESIGAYRYIQELAKALNADLSGGSARLSIDNISVEICLYPSVFVCSKPPLMIPARFEIRTSVPPCPAILIRRNDLIDCFREIIFLQHDFQTGNGNFDKNFFIQVADNNWAHAFFTDEVISTMLKMFSAGFDKISLSEQQMSVSKFVKTTDDCPPKAIIVETGQHLVFLSSLEIITAFKEPVHGEFIDGEEIQAIEQSAPASRQHEGITSDFSFDISNQTLLFLCSMLLTPVMLPIFVGLSFYWTRAGYTVTPSTYIGLLVCPFAGGLLGYFGFMEQRKKWLLLLCILLNSTYSIFIVYGVLRLT